MRRDPGDPEALAVKGAVAKARQGGGVKRGAIAAPPLPSEPAAAADGLNLVGPVPAGPAAEGVAEGAHAEAFGVAEKALTIQEQTEVQNVVSQARSLMGTAPNSAIEKLRMEMGKIGQVPELTADAREQLMDTLKAALREGMRKKTEFDHIRQEEAERRAQGMEEQAVAIGLLRQQQKVQQLIERVDFLLEEARNMEGDECRERRMTTLGRLP